MEEIGLYITILLFILSVIFQNYQLYDDRKKRWYVEVIINTSLNKTEGFYNKIFKEFKNSREKLLSKHTSISQEYLVDKAQEIKKLHRIQNQYNFEIIPFIKSYDKNLAENLENSLLSFQDLYTENIGIEKNIETKMLINKLKNSKSDFYKILYQPINTSMIERVTSENLLLYFLIILIVVVISIIMNNP